MKKLIMLLCLIGQFHILSAAQDSTYTSPSLFAGFRSNFIGSFTNNYGLNHFRAAAWSYVLVKSGSDWRLHNYARDHELLSNTGFGGVITGGLVPLTVPLGMYIYGGRHDNRKLQVTGMALGQAAIQGWLISSLYKTVSGRKPPDILDEDREADDFSDDFKPGLMNRGIFDGWPSGHTTVATAMATTLCEMYPENMAVRFGSIAYAAFVGLSVSTNIHWLSDCVAGWFIGYSIGKSVGRSFAKMRRDEIEQNLWGQVYFTPNGVGMVWEF